MSIPIFAPAFYPRNVGQRHMIQRKQTLFLLAAALLCGASFLLPVATYRSSSAETVYLLLTTRVYDPVNAVTIEDASLKYPIYLVYTVLGLALFIDIFLFKNRKRQLLILRSAYIFAGLLLVLQLVTHQSTTAYLSTGRHLISSYGPVMFFPFGIMLFMYLAERGIKKDEELVKSMDRLR